MFNYFLMDESGSMASSMEASMIGVWSRVRKRNLPGKGKKFQYAWRFSDGESGFIVQNKAKNNKQFRMYLDSNDDGILNRSDRLIVGGKLSQGFRTAKRGDLIDFADSALITAKPFEQDSGGHDHSSHNHSSHDHSGDDQTMNTPLGINELGYEHLSFLNSEMNQVFHDHGAAHAHAHFQGMV